MVKTSFKLLLNFVKTYEYFLSFFELLLRVSGIPWYFWLVCGVLLRCGTVVFQVHDVVLCDFRGWWVVKGLVMNNHPPFTEVRQYHVVQNIDLKHNTTVLYHNKIPQITQETTE
jgi:hypothetical protein